MNFNPLAQFNIDSDDEGDDMPQPLRLATPASPVDAMAIPIMQGNGRMARSGLLHGSADEDSELSDADDNENDAVPEPLQFTVKHLKQQRQSVLAFNAGSPVPGGGPDPKSLMEIAALNQKIQSLTALLDKSRSKTRQQAVDLEDAEDRVAQLEAEVQDLSDKVRHRDHAISNLEYELQRAQKKDTPQAIEPSGFSDKLKLFQSKIAMNTLEKDRKPAPLPRQATIGTPVQRSGSLVGAESFRSPGPGPAGLSPPTHYDSIGAQQPVTQHQPAAASSPQVAPFASPPLNLQSPPPVPATPPPTPQTITVVDETKINELQQQLLALKQTIATKDALINDLHQQQETLKQSSLSTNNDSNGDVVPSLPAVPPVPAPVQASVPEPDQPSKVQSEPQEEALPTVSQAEFIALGEELTSYQEQVVTLQNQCKELEQMLKQQQEAVQTERASLKESKEEWFIEENRLLGMIDDLHSAIQQTSVDLREFKDQVQALQLTNHQQHQQIIALTQQNKIQAAQLQSAQQQAELRASRPTISLPPTPPPIPAQPTLTPTPEAEETRPEPIAESGPLKPASTGPPPISVPTKVVIAPDSDDEEINQPPPPSTPRASIGVRPSTLKFPPTPTSVQTQPPPVSPAIPAPAPAVKPSLSQGLHLDPAPDQQVYEEQASDGELITKGLLTKLGIDANNKPSSKRHFFSLFATKTEYSEYYGSHIKAACELRWGRQETDYVGYPYGATVTSAFVGSNAIQYLRQQGTNGQTLAAMVRPEDVSRLLVMSTVDGRYVLLMCRDSEKGSATGAERAVTWSQAVQTALIKNKEALTPVGAAEDDDDDDSRSSFAPTPVSLSVALPTPTPAPAPATAVASAAVAATPQKATPPPLPHRESTLSPLSSPATTTPKLQTHVAEQRLSTAHSFSSNASSTANTPGTPSLAPAPSPAHFMTRPLVSSTPTVQSTTSSSSYSGPMRGTLTKFIHNGKSWHTKHFSLTLSSGVIQWGDSPTKYKYHEFVKSVLRGQDKDLRIDQKAMKKANFFYNPDLMFSVQTTGKTLYLMAPTEDSLNEWIDALEKGLFNQQNGK